MPELDYLTEALSYLEVRDKKKKYSPKFKQLIAERIVALLLQSKMSTIQPARSTGNRVAYNALTEGKDELAVTPEIEALCPANHTTRHGASMLIRGGFANIYGKKQGAAVTKKWMKQKPRKVSDVREGEQRSSLRYRNHIQRTEKGQQPRYN